MGVLGGAACRELVLMLLPKNKKSKNSKGKKINKGGEEVGEVAVCQSCEWGGRDEEIDCGLGT